MEFETYVASRGQALLRLAYVLSRDTHQAEDLVQNALTEAYRHWRKVRRAEHPDAYVRRILVNQHLTWARRRSSTERVTDLVALDRDSALDHGFAVDRCVAPDHASGVAERDDLRRRLDALPPRSRAVLVLRYYADLDDAAIAELLGIAAGTVRSTASRALATLRDLDATRIPEGRP
jgi:RNA polymerase sigma-70 factor (sigma-E family)